MTDSLRIAVALDGAGWHPAAWHDAANHAQSVLDPEWWSALAQTADTGNVDFITIEDALGRQPRREYADIDLAGLVTDRLDAVLLANFLAARTSRIGLIPSASATHTEPFHVATGIQTLDHVSLGRAGLRTQVGHLASEYRLIGRRTAAELHEIRGELPGEVAALFAEAEDAIEVARRMWDSWEQDAIIRDVASWRFLDADKIHYADFEGEFFSVKGSSIVPRSPQGQPVVAVLGHIRRAYELAAASADLLFVTPKTPAELPGILDVVRRAEIERGRSTTPLQVYVDLAVLLEDSTPAAERELAALDRQVDGQWHSDAAVVASDATALLELIDDYRRHGIAGVRLRPARAEHDLQRIVSDITPRLTTPAHTPLTLRARLGLPESINRYAPIGASA